MSGLRSGHSYSAAELSPEGDRVVLLDQRLLPHEERYLEFADAASVADAIRDMVVRGAPAIGIAAAYALAVEARRLGGAEWIEGMRAAGQRLLAARPTAVNLRWAVEHMSRDLAHTDADQLRARALAVHDDDVAACRAIGAHGAALLPDEGTVLTHCNAGALATGGFGTALGVVRAAIAAGKRLRVLACETRPWLQGARLTAWELARDGVPVELITDGMAAHYFGRGEIVAVVVGADRVARNGDVANKIGTYTHACVARAHDRPFYVAAPSSTLDPRTATGADIVIEERSGEEVTSFAGTRIAPIGVQGRHPAFDVTPAHLVTRLVTERGVVPGPEAARLM
ncbi:MAG: S-methyl-5-thioribose-1-phosphate isomerase [Myxococcales bacterium]|nr:S-methyl-5-thioribose-1-phosphate isomerase [Myxococcales bacterium]